MVISGRGVSTPRFAALSKYYKSPQWKIKRELYFAKNGKWCRACKSREKIQLHHMTYEHFTCEPLSDLIALCEPCHKEVTILCRKSGHRDDRLVTMQFIKNKR